jgi:8-oxo-dGTP pyrophosphatase MutT (NUDIX family)
MGQMYKVFFNEQVVFIEAKKNESLFNNDIGNTTTSNNYIARPCNKSVVLNNTFHIETLGDFSRFWSLFVADKGFSEAIITGKTEAHVFAVMKDFFHVVEAAGGLVFDDLGRILFIERMGRWDLPKGKIDKGETAVLAAMREVEEETGVVVSENLKEITTTFHVYSSPYHNSEWVLKPTYWFEMQMLDSSKIAPQISEDITKVCWFSPVELNEVLANTYSSLKDIICSYAK